MPKRKTDRQNFKQRKQGFFDQSELAAWLGVSPNSVPRIAKRFNLTDLDGSYPEAAVWRKVLGIIPRHEDDRALLRRPLKCSAWFAIKTGLPRSTIRRKIRAGTLEYPVGVQLAVESEGGFAPRSRRWIPSIIEAMAQGKAPPAFDQVETENAGLPLGPAGDVELPPPPAINVFEQIVRSSAGGTQQ